MSGAVRGLFDQVHSLVRMLLIVPLSSSELEKIFRRTLTTLNVVQVFNVQNKWQQDRSELTGVFMFVTYLTFIYDKWLNCIWEKKSQIWSFSIKNMSALLDTHAHSVWAIYPIDMYMYDVWKHCCTISCSGISESYKHETKYTVLLQNTVLHDWLLFILSACFLSKAI